MLIPAVISFTAAYFTLIIAGAVFLRDRRSLVHKVFAAGMLLLAAEEVCRGFSYKAVLPEDVLYWQKCAVVISALVPGVWLAFSLSYARRDSHTLRAKSEWAFVILCCR